MSSKVFLFSILMIVLPVCYVHFYSNNVISDYIIYCNRGVLIFRKPNVDVLISDIENQCNIVKIDQYNMDNIIDTEVNKQFTRNTDITNKWVNVKWNNSHNVCTINLGREGVDIISFIDIVENKCNVASANHIKYNHTEF